jgi:hypothetical protein
MRPGGFSLWRASALALLVLVLTAVTGLAAWIGHGPWAGYGGRAGKPFTYYVSPAGNDAAAGSSPAAAWRTLRRASSAVLRPGTWLLLAGGKSFTGQLRFSQADAGDATRPVHVGSYGRGRATIVTRSWSGIVIDNTAGISISDLNLVGMHSPPNGEGINLYNDLPGRRKLDHVVVDRVNVSGFANGFAIGGRGGAGFRDVWVGNTVLHDNLDNGLLSYGPPFNAARPSYANAHIYLRRVTAYRNRGDPAQTRVNSGSGIVLGSVRGATVAWSTAHDNGGAGGDTHQGPQGIWAYDSTGVVIEHNLSYGNLAVNNVDGGGFDLDQNTSHSIVQYNLSYGNSGPGYLLFSGQKNSAATGNVLRFNISSGDTRTDTNYSGIQIAGWVIDAAVYQNTVVMSRRAGTDLAIPLLLGRHLVGLTVRNNIFVTYQPGLVVDSRGALPRSAVLLQGNDYFSTAGTWAALWGNATYYSLAAWRAGTGQEMRAGKATGYAVSPGLAGQVLGLRVTRAGGGRTRFQLRPGSPLVGAGLDLTRLFGVQPGPANYAGRAVTSTALNVGAQ